MLLQSLFLASVTSLAVAQKVTVTVAKSFTGWDCCKPVCANSITNATLLAARGAVKVCDKNNKVQDTQAGLTAYSGCQGGSAFMCDSFQPVPVQDDLSYGFAYQVSDTQQGTDPNCCKCYEIEWLSGPAASKRMIAQIVTPGGAGGDVKRNDLIILTPGGGLGPLSAGCPAQYGATIAWGENRGGFKNRTGCDGLPANLQGGCYWRYNWARGDMNGWDISYHQVTCPSRLTAISGCEAKF